MMARTIINVHDKIRILLTLQKLEVWDLLLQLCMKAKNHKCDICQQLFASKSNAFTYRYFKKVPEGKKYQRNYTSNQCISWKHIAVVHKKRLFQIFWPTVKCKQTFVFPFPFTFFHQIQNNGGRTIPSHQLIEMFSSCFTHRIGALEVNLRLWYLLKFLEKIKIKT